jgi:hypothetical protein
MIIDQGQDDDLENDLMARAYFMGAKTLLRLFFRDQPIKSNEIPQGGINWPLSMRFID